MTGVILSGGKNSRMGTNKALLSVNGERLIDRTIRIYRDLFPEIILVTNNPLAYLDLDVTIVTDLEKNKGPLMGIYTGLYYASGDHVFIAACDMPFFNLKFIRSLMESTSPEDDIVVPVSANGFEPLHAVYSKRCMGPIRHLLEANRFKITEFYRKMTPKIIGEDIIRSFDPDGLMFINVNAPQDLHAITSFQDQHFRGGQEVQ